MYYLDGWESTETIKTEDSLPQISVSIIVPARNEEKNIGKLIESILNQDYNPSFIEVIIIDDNSEDQTAEIVKSFNNQNIKLFNLKDLIIDYATQNAYKKRAIEQAVQMATGKLIITTDADCMVPPRWISSIVSLYVTKKPKLITGPVAFTYDQSLFQKFQALDFMSMIGITAASLNKGMFNLANGANLAYEKEAFLEVNGYQDIDKKASGDDMFLIYKIAQNFKNEVAFLKNKDAIVLTNPNKSINEFIQQRFRWTSKSFSYQDKRITLILGWVYLFNLIIILSLILVLFGTIKLISLITILAFKFLVDYVFLKRVSAFFGERKLLKIFFVSEIIHVFYIVSIGTLGNFINSKWKGRTIK
jgi:cellulose synthase/poly-beta-1,6-N-acetylglucosamine synthase-like glycosyltransferase